MTILTRLLLAILLAAVVAAGWSTIRLGHVKTERDLAVTERDNATSLLALKEQEAALRAAENDRLSAVLQARRAREAKMDKIASNLQEKISALPTTCVFSPDASRVLWEIYDSATGVQDPVSLRHPTAPADEGASSPDG